VDADSQNKLTTEFAYFKIKEGQSMDEHLDNFNDLLARMEWAEIKGAEANNVLRLLQSLTSEYKEIKTFIINTGDLTMANAERRLRATAGRMVDEAKHEAAEAAAIAQHVRQTVELRPNVFKGRLHDTAAAAQQAPPPTEHRGNRNFGVRHPRCFKCNSPNHMIAQCQAKGPRSTPPPGGYSRCPICNGFGHSPYICPKREHFNEEPTSKYHALLISPTAKPSHQAASVQPHTQQSPTLLDSGATTHFVRDLAALHHPIELPVPIAVRTADNSITTCTTAGDIHLFTPLGMLQSRAIHTPTFANNLISVPQLLRETDGSCTLKSTSWQLHNKNGAVLLEGTKKNGLYILPQSSLASANLIGATLADAKLLTELQQINFSNGVDPSKCNLPSQNLTGTNLTDANLSSCVLTAGAIEQPTDEIPTANIVHSDSLWHHRLNHACPEILRQMQKLTKIPKYRHEASGVCDICAKAKMTKALARKFKPKRHVATEVLERIHSDIAGPYDETTRGHRYFIVFVDEMSRHTLAYPMRHKSDAKSKFQQCLIDFKKLAPNFKPRFYRSDNAPELTASLKKLCDELGITMTSSAPRSPNQNGIAERTIRTLKEAVRSNLEQFNNSAQRQRPPSTPMRPAPLGYWDVALEAAVYVKNKMVSTVTSLIPEEVITGRPIDISGIRPFGCTTYVLNPSPASSLSSKAITTILIGFQDNHTYKCFDITNNQTRISRDVRFDESSVLRRSADLDTINQEINNLFGPAIDAQDEDEELEDLEPEQEEVHQQQDQAPPVANPRDASEDESATDDDEAAPVARPAPRRGARVRRESPSSIAYWKSLRGQQALLTLQQETIEEEEEEDSAALLTLEANAAPTPDEAWKDEKWKASMQREIDSQTKNGTWQLVDLPAGCKAIGNKWHLKTKTSASGEIIDYKSRLVAQGFSQVLGRDYNETFAPVCKMSSFRSLIALAGPKNLHLEHLDVKTAFLQAELPEDSTIYMRQPRFFEKPGQENKVCLLKKGLYGLKQGQRVWNKKFEAAMAKLGFNCTQQRADTCIYVKKGTNGELTILLVYVDDIILASDTPSSAKTVKHDLMAEFDIRDLGDLKFFLGVHVERTPDGGYFLHQRKHAQDILEYFGMQDCKALLTPMEMKKALKRREPTEQRCNQESFRTGIGALLYLCNTRPDLSQAVSVLSKFVNDPSAEHEVAFKRVLRYLRGTTGEGVAYKGQGSDLLEGWADADYAGDPEDRKSTSGFLLTINGRPVSWTSRKQKTVALSSTEPEYVSLSNLCQEVKWFRQLLQDVDSPQLAPTTLFEDNQGAQATANNPTSHQRMKHVDVRFHFIREQVANGEVRIQYCPTSQNVADILTKPLSAEVIARHKQSLGVGALAV
jgi:transposase InsO family protein